MPTLRSDLPPLPARIAALPVDPDRGYPVPWFVAWQDGKPEFRCGDERKLRRAIREKLCWVCGTPAGPHFTFVIGPMCALNRNTSEPGCHQECAEFSVRACPFLSKPHMVRRAGLPEESIPGPGFMILRNPGATCLWRCRGFAVHEYSRGVLFELFDPMSVTWWKEGRPATRAEVLHSIETGLPTLVKVAQREGREALKELERFRIRAEQYLPAA